jgi:signal peptidase I
VALRPLVVPGLRRVRRALTFSAIFFALLLGSAALGYYVFFHVYIVPTGAMALTIQGYHRDVQCPECGHWSAVNLSSQMDPDPMRPPAVVTGCTCENCRRHITLPPGDAVSGDRILTARFFSPPGDLPRAAVVTFWLPERAQEPDAPIYVMRLMGLPGETLAISYGRLYRTTALSYDDAAINPEERWRRDHMHENDPRAVELFQQGKFEILRKDPQTLLALRRLVYDNDHQAADLAGVLPPRWAGGAWAADGTAFRSDGRGAGVDWLRYRHVLRPHDWPERSDPNHAERLQDIKRRAHKPELIRDFFAYNAFEVNNEGQRPQSGNWVGDLMLECRLAVTKAEGEFWLELSKGVDRFRAQFDLASGNCTLFRLGADGKLRQLQAASTRVKQPGQYLLRLANVDERLTLWVDDDLPFGDGAAYDPPGERGPTANDLEPASLGSKGAAVSVQELKLYRDTYYGTRAGEEDFNPVGGSPERFWSDPAQWGPLRELPVRTVYVQPGHYFVLGDNSAASSDSRDWGVVPEGLLAGRVLLIYLPARRAGLIR